MKKELQYYGRQLYHHGILGMKWGKRNGPPYPLDQSSRSSAERKMQKSKNAERTAEYANRASSINEGARRVNRGIGKLKRTASSQDVSKMSDEELRKLVNRLNMEQQYSDLTSRRVSKGETYLDEIMDVAGGVLAMTSSALLIYANISKIRGGG